MLDILSLIPNFHPPFSTPDKLLATIDKIPFGELKSFKDKLTPQYQPDEFDNTSDEGEGEEEGLCNGAPPALWFQEVSFLFYNIHSTVQHLFPRPDLVNPTEYVACKALNKNGDQVISNFMTANWQHQVQANASPSLTVYSVLNC